MGSDLYKKKKKGKKEKKEKEKENLTLQSFDRATLFTLVAL